jgi:hypothetical protein
VSFYKEARRAADGTMRYSAYDHADSIADIAEAYKRCRKAKDFILQDGAPELDTLCCAVCGKVMSDYGDAPKGYRGNLGVFYPKSRTFTMKHYLCGWNSLLGAICTSYSLSEAGAKYERIERQARQKV